MSAHPKKDHEKKELYNLAYETGSDIVNIYSFDEQWKMLHKCMVKITNSRMIHDL